MIVALAAVVAFVVVLLIPDTALAWAPATHLEIGLRLLDALPQAPAAVAALLASHGDDFLYGMLATDIQIGKSLRGYEHNSHNWKVAARVESAARTPQERAFVLGYRAHLAADVIGHNVFLPRHIVESFEALGRGHAYWETRFDACMPERAFRTGRRLARLDVRRHDAIVRRQVSRTLFSFDTDRRILFGMARLQRLARWRRGLEMLGRRSDYALSRAEVERYLGLCVQSVRDAISRPRRAMALKADPTGERALSAAVQMRRTLRRWRREGKLIKIRQRPLVNELERSFEAALTGALELPDLRDFVTLGPSRKETRVNRRNAKREVRKQRKAAKRKKR